MNGNGQVTPKTREKFVISVQNSASQTKRGLLDFLDFQEAVLLRDPKLEPIYEHIKDVFAYSKKRIHNDLSMMRDQVLACFEIYANGGDIPAFGRSDAERAAAADRSHR